MKYRIEWLEQKTTSTGKNMYKVSIKDEKGEMHTEVAIWEGFPNFAELKSGMDIEGDIQVKQNGQYVNKSLYAPKVATTGFVGRGGGIAKAQETKASMVERAQENKGLSIKIASTASMANATALAFMAGQTIVDEGVFRSEFKRWRAFYWKEWDKEDKDFEAF